MEILALALLVISFIINWRWGHATCETVFQQQLQASVQMLNHIDMDAGFIVVTVIEAARYLKKEK